MALNGVPVLMIAIMIETSFPMLLRRVEAHRLRSDRSGTEKPAETEFCYVAHPAHDLAMDSKRAWLLLG